MNNIGFGDRHWGEQNNVYGFDIGYGYCFSSNYYIDIDGFGGGSAHDEGNGFLFWTGAGKFSLFNHCQDVLIGRI